LRDGIAAEVPASGRQPFGRRFATIAGIATRIVAPMDAGASIDAGAALDRHRLVHATTLAAAAAIHSRTPVEQIAALVSAPSIAVPGCRGGHES
jgi:hypothetical protein